MTRPEDHRDTPQDNGDYDAESKLEIAIELLALEHLFCYKAKCKLCDFVEENSYD